ncbi:MAG: MFS transporter [Pseudomonadota bacterium]
MTDVTANGADAAVRGGSDGQSFGSLGYRTYVLLTLTVVYTFNFIDRILISVVGRPIIDEFGLTNFQFGILSGLGFALFYTLLGIPIASLSERVSRVRIIGVCVILWSAATVACGFTTGFVTLLLARLAVGVGEAGCTPPANSLISDYYKPVARPTALGIYAVGITAGGVLAQVGGGWMIQNFTWREAFIYVGAPGVLIGLLVLLSIKEPPRGYSDPPGAAKPERASFTDALSEVISKRTFWLVTLASTICAFAGYSLTGFAPLHIQYTHGYTAGETAIQFMAIFGIAGSVGAFLGGWLTERANRFSGTAACWVPGIALILCGPFYFTGFVTMAVPVLVVTMIAANLLQYTYLGAQYNISQAVVSLRVRATSVAIFLFIVNLIGYGVGPPTFGLIADQITNDWIAASAFAGEITANCSLTDPDLSEALLGACLEAKAVGIRWACAYATLLFSLAGVFFVITSSTFVKDVQSAQAKGV